MNLRLFLPACIALGVGATFALRPEPAPAAPPVAPLEARVAQLARALEALSASQDELARGLERLSAPAAPAAPSPVSEQEIAQAIERYVERPARGGETAAAPSSIEGQPMEEILRYLADPVRTGAEADALLLEVRLAGRFDKYVAAVEARAAADPRNIPHQLSVANAYLSQELDRSGTPQSLEWAERAEQAYDRVLALEPENWRARIGKALALAEMPDSLGRRGKAIAELEILRAQQEARPEEPQGWRTYLFLGGLYERSGNRALALATWEAGLAHYPRNPELGERLSHARR
jgi:tetratricopeptide (TPR) repeat protein